MKVALITGLEFEAQIVRKAVGGSAVFVAGLGAPFAEMVVAQAKQAGVQGIVSFGVCGGLDPDLPAGAVVMPETILGPTAIPADMDWRERLLKDVQGHYDVATGPILSVKETVTSVAEKSRLFQQTGACAVDMESAVLANEAAKHQLAFIAVRVVHDPASQAIPKAFADIMKPDGQIDPWRLVKGLFFHWPGFSELKKMSDNDMQARTNLKGLARLALSGLG